MLLEHRGAVIVQPANFELDLGSTRGLTKPAPYMKLPASAFSSLLCLLVAGCTDRPTQWHHENLLDPVIFDSAHRHVDYRFRICKDGDVSTEEASAHLRVTTTSPEVELSISQWDTVEDFDNGLPADERARGSGGELEAILDSPTVFDVPGPTCGAWSVFRIAVEEAASAVTLEGALILDFRDDAAPFDELFVEMPHQ